MFRRDPIIPIVDKQRPTETQALVEDTAIKSASEIFKNDMDAIRQAVVMWVYCNYGDRLDDFFYGSNLVSLIGLTETQFYEKLGAIDLFWDRMEREVKIVKVNRALSYVNMVDNRVIFHCYIVNDVNQHVIIEEVLG